MKEKATQTSVSALPSEWKKLRKLAHKAETSLSRYLIESGLRNQGRKQDK